MLFATGGRGHWGQQRSALLRGKLSPAPRLSRGSPMEPGLWGHELAPSLIRNVTNSKRGSGRGEGGLGAGTLLP